MKILTFGDGYLNSYLKHDLELKVSSRTPDSNQLFFDLGSKLDLPDFEVYIFGIPPSAQNYLPGLEHLLHSLGPSTKQFILISSTGVFANEDKEYTEDSSADGTRSNSQILIKAENLVKEVLPEKYLIIRPGGIFGPGRNPGNFFKDGIVKDSKSPVNFIHVKDLSKIISLSVGLGLSKQTLHAVQETSLNKGDFYSHAFKLCQRQDPVLEDQLKSKKIKAKKLDSLLKYKFIYPDLISALSNINGESTL